MAKADKIKLELWSERFLGSRAKGDQLLPVIESMDGGKWRPDKWGHFEPVRLPYTAESRERILAAVSEERGGRIANDIYLRKQKPAAFMGWLAWRSRVPSMNSFWADLEAIAFSTPDGVDRLKKIVKDLVLWSGAVYATVRHTKQNHYRIAQKTPEERLQQLDWLSFFGERYIELFGGKQRVLSAPCFSVEDVLGGVLLLASHRPDSPQMTESDETLIALEEYLGKDAFAGQGYPSVPCRVPSFDLSETVVGTNSEPV